MPIDESVKRIIITLNKEQTIEVIQALEERSKTLSNLQINSAVVRATIKTCDDLADDLIKSLQT